MRTHKAQLEEMAAELNRGLGRPSIPVDKEAQTVKTEQILELTLRGVQVRAHKPNGRESWRVYWMASWEVAPVLVALGLLLLAPLGPGTYNDAEFCVPEMVAGHFGQVRELRAGEVVV